MKKIGLIMMPLLALAALTNCNKSNPKLDPLNTPLCFTCLSDSATITVMSFSKLPISNQKSYGGFPNLEYSYNGRTGWKLIDGDFDYDHLPTFTLKKEQTIYFRGDNPGGIQCGATFMSKRAEGSDYPIYDGDLQLKGNIMSLVSKKGFAELTKVPTGQVGAFADLFNHNRNIVDANELLLPTELAPSCYKTMFNGCDHLIKAPKLNATKMYESCYSQMFRGCSALENAPILPATNLDLEKSCYDLMFGGCKKLKSVQVGFGTPSSSDWPGTDFSFLWLSGVASSGTFKWKGNDAVTRDNHHVPKDWEVKTIS